MYMPSTVLCPSNAVLRNPQTMNCLSLDEGDEDIVIGSVQDQVAGR